MVPSNLALGHFAFALNVPADTFRSHLGRPQELAALLDAAGVNPAQEVVLMAESGLTPGAALGFLAFEQIGQKMVSVLMDSVDKWGLRGYALTKEPTVVGMPETARDITVPATSYAAQPREGVLVGDPSAGRGLYPKVFVASGKTAPARLPAGQVVQLPYTDLLNTDGTPKAAAELWKRISAAGVPRYAALRRGRLVRRRPCRGRRQPDLLRLMGWPDVKVWVN